MPKDIFKPVAYFVVPQFYPAALFDNISAPADPVTTEQGGVGGDQQPCCLLSSRSAFGHQRWSKYVQQGAVPGRDACTFAQLRNQSTQHCAHFHPSGELPKIFCDQSPSKSKLLSAHQRSQ